MYYALEITRVYEFEDINEREAFLRHRPISRMRICPECARRMLSIRKNNEFLREIRLDEMRGMHETINR